MSADLIVADKATLPTFALTGRALQMRDEALESAALIGSVTNAAQNQVAVAAQSDLKRISVSFEKARKELKEPLLEAGRQLDRAVKTELVEIEQEIGRISHLVSTFAMEEARRVREEEELQRREIERLEHARQAELLRIQTELAAKQRAIEAEHQRVLDASLKAEAEAAAQLAAAKTAAEREAAEAKVAHAAANTESNLTEAAKACEAAIVTASAATEAAQDLFAAKVFVEAQPIIPTRVSGQVIKTDWEIEITNPYELAKWHPDMVTITPKLPAIKARLNANMEVHGVTAKKITTSTVRVAPERPAISI